MFINIYNTYKYKYKMSHRKNDYLVEPELDINKISKLHKKNKKRKRKRGKI